MLSGAKDRPSLLRKQQFEAAVAVPDLVLTFPHNLYSDSQ